MKIYFKHNNFITMGIKCSTDRVMTVMLSCAPPSNVCIDCFIGFHGYFLTAKKALVENRFFVSQYTIVPQ